MGWVSSEVAMSLLHEFAAELLVADGLAEGEEGLAAKACDEGRGGSDLTDDRPELGILF